MLINTLMFPYLTCLAISHSRNGARGKCDMGLVHCVTSRKALDGF